MNSELINQYLLDQMSIDERSRFEQEMYADPALKKEVAITKVAIESTEDLGRSNLKSSLQNIHAEIYEQPNNNINRIILTVLILLVTITLAWWVLQKNETQHPVQESRQLFAQYYKPIEFSIAKRSDIGSELAHIKDLYDQEKYNLVLEETNKILENQDLQSSNLLLLKAISNIELNNKDKAIISLERIIKNNDFNYEDQAKWYLGLVYLNLDKRDKALSYFKELAIDPNSDNHKEVLEISKILQGK